MCHEIHDIVLVTRDRTALLERSLERYLRNTQTLNRSVRFHVFDDAIDASGLDANAAVVRQVSTRWGCRISHISRLDRARWVDALLRELRGAVSEDLVRWGLLGSTADRDLTGAHRNAIALSMIDRAILCSDDDVAPPVGPMLGIRRGVELDRHRDPTEFHFFRSRKEAIGAISPTDLNVLELHELLLGRTVAACFAGEGQGLPNELKESPDARVVMTMAGLAGDSGMGSSLYFALLQGPSRVRWAGGFERFAESREVARAAPVATISGSGFLMTANVGLDLGAWLPPFVPSGRNQEGPMAFALQHVNQDFYIGHIPYLLSHDPPGTREATLAQAVEAVRQPTASHLLTMCMSALPRQELEEDAAAARLGSFLAECAEDPQAFDHLLRERAARFQEVRMTRLEDILASRTDEPEAWAQHIRRLLRAAEGALDDPDYPVALGLEAGPEQRRSQVRACVRGYGELLTAWPALRSAAREVRRKGRGLVPA